MLVRTIHKNIDTENSLVVAKCRGLGVGKMGGEESKVKSSSYKNK